MNRAPIILILLGVLLALGNLNIVTGGWIAPAVLIGLGCIMLLFPGRWASLPPSVRNGASSDTPSTQQRRRSYRTRAARLVCSVSPGPADEAAEEAQAPAGQRLQNVLRIGDAGQGLGQGRVRCRD